MFNPFVNTSISAGFLTLILATPADAALIGGDWQTTGDGLMIRDTTTNLEWLKLTETAGMSYGGVSGQLGAGGAFEGLRYATNIEVGDLFGSYFGIALGTGALYGERPAYLDPGVRLASETLGDGISGGTDEFSGPNANYRLVGLTGDLMLDGSRFALGAVTRWSDTDYYTMKDPLTFGDHYAGDFPWIGSYLVRTSAVPLPAAAWLLGWGLVGLGAFAGRSRT